MVIIVAFAAFQFALDLSTYFTRITTLRTSFNLPLSLENFEQSRVTYSGYWDVATPSAQSRNLSKPKRYKYFRLLMCNPTGGKVVT